MMRTLSVLLKENLPRFTLSQVGLSMILWKFGQLKVLYGSKHWPAGIKSEQVAAIGITNQRETTIVWDKKQEDLFTMRLFGKADKQRKYAINCIKQVGKNISVRPLV